MGLSFRASRSKTVTVRLCAGKKSPHLPADLLLHFQETFPPRAWFNHASA